MQQSIPTSHHLNSFFEKYLTNRPLFVNKKVLQQAYTPETIPHREEYIKHIADILAPSLRLETPSNIFIYGKTGTGKTLSVKYTLQQLSIVAREKDIPIRTLYVNCKMKRVADTEYRLLAQLIREMGRAVPSTGLPTDEIYNIFFGLVDYTKQVVIIALDEIDQLVKKTGDEILYNLTRIGSELRNASISIIGISNDLTFVDRLDPRIKSSLSEEEIIFPPYNAIQLQDILRDRAKKAFRKGVVGEGVIEKCAAYAAREHGDARRALELLRVAGELAERHNADKIELKHIDMAEEKIERDRILDAVSTQPKQFQAVLYAIYNLYQKNKINNNGKSRIPLYTGDVYDNYRKICRKANLRPLTQRRVSDIINEFDMQGLITTTVISKGRYGRTREINITFPDSLYTKIEKILRDALNL